MKGLILLSIIGCVTLVLSFLVVNIDLATDLFIAGVLLCYFALALFATLNYIENLYKNKNK
jgi:hypothetical protein